ncbi:hypothetical protein CABS01_01309 [Colletotrichum abscissum]|uniref:Uncharacterized protein n=1 Tax=Colletotrichum abscissum TaxID=1671311 RepID=A0A9P9XFG3_9PEZI|nr:uncharacterized protein CABS01_01309 [Colletotrichum abscissum]KAI3553207.1 hypothetical protein CABS02_06562 [Colletotrichum abscissum]KAK1505841.1 hypothetical protein CABS01_01309 [Colletotrichum abscissum]
MFIPGIVQALVSALTFGIVIQAATPAVFPLAKGHGSKIFRDGLRLVLITFLVSSALWAQIDFTGITLDPTSTAGCQVAVIFTTIFDQLARFTIEQFLLWAINANARAPASAMVYQAVLGVRFILGGVFVGFQKAQIATVCVARNDLLAIGAVVMVTDFAVIAALAFRANSIGITSVPVKKAIFWVIGALALWTATSIPMLLGIDTIELIFRTALPATGLSILLSILTGSLGVLLPPRQKQEVHPDAQSPRNISSSRDLSTSDTDYPPSRYEDLKGGTITTVTTFNQPVDFGGGVGGGALPTMPSIAPGQASTGVGGVPVQGQLFPPIRAQTAPPRQSRSMDARPNIMKGRSIFDKIGPGSNIKNAISNPILQDSGEQNPLSKIATIDLATAAKNDREKRGNDFTSMQRNSSFNAQRPAPKPPAITPEEALKRAQSGKRKEIGLKSPPAEPQQLRSVGLMSNPPATTSSAQLSPGVEEIRRRSPRQMPETLQQLENEKRPVTPPQTVPVSSISPPRPQRPERPLSPFETMDRSASQRTVERTMSQKTQKTLDRSVSQKSSTATEFTVASPPLGLVPPPPPKSAARLMSPTKKPDLPPTWPIQTAVDPTIRPSRQKPLSPKTPGGSSLQRRPTGGLPSNPRAMAMRPLPKDAVQQEQTVMFVNKIQYNDPTAVQSIIEGASNQAAKTPHMQSPGPGLKSSGSVVHRPRPIPRQQGKDRQIFPAENSPNHRRSKSGGSIMSRKSILLSNPGSPTQLPPLPPPPKSAGNHPVRALPNDTKSMTFDEKMDLFFPGALGNSEAGVQPRTPVPEMPMVPLAFKPASNSGGDERDAWESGSSRDQSKQSDRSTKTSIRTQSILDIEESVRPDLPRNTSKFSVDTSVITGRPDEHDSWIPALPVNDTAEIKRAYDGAKRQSSPVLPVRNLSLSEFSETRTVRTRDEETTTNWGSIHSPVAPVNIQEATHMPKPTWIQPRDLSMISHNDGKEVMTIMLDASIEHERDVEAPQEARESPVNLPEVSLANRGARWHRRIGDESITFTERKEPVQSRRQPPPRALQLRSPVKKNAIVMHAAEPSPLESPQHAYEMIQAQLKKLEQPNRDSYESQGQRIRLLESLEAEMGQQENQWHEMQHGLSRDSMSTVGTTSVRNSQHESAIVNSRSLAQIDESLQEIPQRNNIALDRRNSRRARMGSMSKSSSEDLRTLSASSLSSDGTNNNRTSLWQQRLADAQMEYMENASELLAKRNLNFLSVSKAPLSATAAALQLGSPTPPDTDEESDGADGVNAQILARLMPNERAPAPPECLWKPDSPVYFEREPPLLWAPPANHGVASKVTSPNGDTLPGISVRPATRKVSDPLNIVSSQLWQPDHTAAKKLRPTSGLWRVSWSPEPIKDNFQQPQRPLTQRPPRRSKRVTLLPDILESPQPLPDKRGTLGIFQFPWGEKSDTATVQPRGPSHMFMAMPGTMSTGGPAVRAALEARAKQLEAQEYSSSFFDDYDDEEEGDDEVSDIEDDEDSDDGFDETTLWEIASLLQSDQVPSKNSLLPQPITYRPESFAEEYISERSQSEYEDSEDEKTAEDNDDPKHDSMVITIAAEDFASSPEPVSLLWTPKPKHFISRRTSTGLPQPDARVWGSYLDKMSAPARVRERLPEPAVIHSTSLWTAPAKKQKLAQSNTPLWSKPQQQQQRKSKKTSMWAARPAVIYTESTGLFNPSHKRACFRTTSALPVGLGMPSAARVTSEELPQLESFSLWAPTPAETRIEDWMSLAVARPSSRASSGRSTPSLDTASTRSDDEEAVSDFEPLPEVPAVKQPTWWDSLKSQMSAQPQSTQPEPLRRTTATAAQWEAALSEAIGAIPSPRLVRKASTPSEWAEALNRAVFSSSFNAATSHPALAGSVTTTTVCDPAVANPIFFASVPSTVVPLWTAPVVTIPKDTGIMWIPPTKPRRHAHDTTPMKPEDPESRRLRIKRTKKMGGTSTDPSTFGLVSFDGQAMWNDVYGAELRSRSVTPLGGNRYWIAEDVAQESVEEELIIQFG